jgi:hypothetical protein
MPEIKTFAKEHGVKSNGTRAQIIQRLRSHLGLENSMTKIFTSILGGSGRSRTYHSVTLILFLVSYISGGFVGAWADKKYPGFGDAGFGYPAK